MDENKFLHEIEIRAGLSRDQSYKVTLAALQELHDRLDPKEADDLGAQLPGELKAIWHGFDAPGRDVRRTHRKDFVKHIAEVVEIGESEADKALTAVFKALQILLRSPTGQEGEAWDVYSQLPKDLKRVWAAAARLTAPTTKTAGPPARQDRRVD